MIETTWKGKLTAHTGELMAALLIIQPLLDVLSYFMQQVGATVFTTTLRMALLVAVSVYGFVISDHKKVYGVFCGIVGGFWILHMISCLRSGYVDPVADAAEYLKLLQFPLWTLCFITFFQKREELNGEIIGVLAVNFGIILLVIGLSFLVGSPVYTYDYPERNMQIGILGWFGVANSQSAILAILVPPLLLWAYRTEKLWIFSLCSLLGFGLLYYTGTRLTFYAAVVIAAVVAVLVLLERKHLLFCIPLLAALALLLLFRGASPMAERQDRTAGSYAIYQEKTDAVMGEDKDFVYKPGTEISPQLLEKIRRVYEDVYGGPGLYGVPLLGDLLDRFGTEAVMEQYKYSIRPEALYNSRTKKLAALDMVWKEKDFFTKMFGFEYAEVVLGDNIYDPENDFPALLYYYGYVGTALYLGFIAYFILMAAIAFFKNIRLFLTVEFGSAALMFGMALGAAQFSGQVLRKPSVTVYFSVAAALLFMMVHPVQIRRGSSKYERQAVVFIKKI